MIMGEHLTIQEEVTSEEGVVTNVEFSLKDVLIDKLDAFTQYITEMESNLQSHVDSIKVSQKELINNSINELSSYLDGCLNKIHAEKGKSEQLAN